MTQQLKYDQKLTHAEAGTSVTWELYIPNYPGTWDYISTHSTKKSAENELEICLAELEHYAKNIEGYEGQNTPEEFLETYSNCFTHSTITPIVTICGEEIEDEDEALVALAVINAIDSGNHRIRYKNRGKYHDEDKILYLDWHRCWQPISLADTLENALLFGEIGIIWPFGSFHIQSEIAASYNRLKTKLSNKIYSNQKTKLESFISEKRALESKILELKQSIDTVVESIEYETKMANIRLEHEAIKLNELGKKLGIKNEIEIKTLIL